MAEKGQTSSMTSVTEEETSADSESDTTESSCSNITSSMLSSTDTDDKLTPGLFSISISNNSYTASMHKNQLKTVKVPTDKPNDEQSLSIADIKDFEKENTFENGASVTPTNALRINFEHPYGCNPLPLEDTEEDERWKNHSLFHPIFGPYTAQEYGKQKLRKCCKENLGVDDTDGKLSTDFSDTSSIPRCNDRNNNNDLDTDSNKDSESEGSGNNNRQFLPDLSSDKWYQAQCFDRYWSHYRFVMEWYSMHVQTVKSLQHQMINAWPCPQMYVQEPRQSYRRNSRRNQRSSKRSAKSRARRRNRRKARSASCSSEEQNGTAHAGTKVHSSRHNKQLSHSEDHGEELEMEITDDMLEFFATSLKHKIERDKEEQAPISSAPTERPGVRRTEEMKELYGVGAPMIQAMETAVQMTFDRFLDRFQPSLWPNMPLKINFGK